MRPVKLCERGVKVPYGSMVLPGSTDEKERVFEPFSTYLSARVGQAAARPLTTYPSARVGQAAARPLTTYPSARVGQAAARPLTRVGDRHPGVGQGALTVAARIVESVPDMDSKFYAATQAMDEPRHVELYHRFIRDKIGLYHPINTDLAKLLADALSDSRWEMPYLGMQVLIEGWRWRRSGCTATSPAMPW